MLAIGELDAVTAGAARARHAWRHLQRANACQARDAIIAVVERQPAIELRQRV